MGSFPDFDTHDPFPKPKVKASEFADGNCCFVSYEFRLFKKLQFQIFQSSF